MPNQHKKYYFYIAIVAALFFIPFLGGVHLFDWDEINFAEISREMIETGDYLQITIDYQPFWEKPPLFSWLQVIAMKVFGVNEFAARLPNAICGIITLLLLFKIGTRLYSQRLGLLWVLTYLGSILPHLYFRSGIIDPVFNLFIFLSLYFFVLFYWKKEKLKSITLLTNKWQILSIAGIMLGLAMLTKGPAAYLIFGLTLFVYWIFQKFRLYVSVLEFLIFTIIALLTTGIWFGLEIINHGFWFVQEFIVYQYRLFSTPDAGHGGFPGYHFVVLLLGCFPASIFALRSFFKMSTNENEHQKDFTRWMKILFWVVLILFSIVQSKIVHYSSLCYFPLTFLAARTIHHIIENDIQIYRWIKISLGFIASLYIFATILLPYLGNHIELLIPYINDPFAIANMEAEVIWTGWESLAGLFLLATLITFFIVVKKKKEKAIVLLFFGSAIFVTLTLFLFINKIESYSQRAAIEFFKDKVGEDCYIATHGYKSYAHLFYSKKSKEIPSLGSKWTRLTKGEIDKDVYFISKIHRADELKEYPDIKEIGRKNGFVFFKRTKK